MADLHEIVITGGSCGGKSSSLGYLQEKLSERGYRVFIVPEVPTMLILGGVNDIGKFAARYLSGKASPEETQIYLGIQKQIFLAVQNLRQRFLALADLFPNEKRVIFYDRGAMDISSYMGKKHFETMIHDSQLNYYDVRDSYSGVIHLVTAAVGAEEFYTLANNEARYEGIEEARVADRRTLDAWTGHPKLRIIDNSTNFEEKMKRALTAVSSILGIPEPLEIEHKFLLKNIPDFSQISLDKKIHITEIEQTYLQSVEGVEKRARKRQSDGGVHYYLTEKIFLATGKRLERERAVSEQEYAYALRERDPEKAVVKKTRYTFPYHSTYCEVDIFQSPEKISLLEIELTHENETYEIPNFLEVERDVTAEAAYSNAGIASRGNAKL